MKLIVGLGNPGSKYEQVKHNLGFRVVDEFSVKCKVQSAKWEYEEKFKSEIVKCQLSNVKCILVKPQTYMNNSGLAVKLLTSYYKISPTDIIVVHDELDLPLGKIKVRVGGSAAGHHGVESIIDSLGTDQFVRVRLGIGNEKSHSGEHQRVSFAAEEFVLEQFLPTEKPEVSQMVKQAAEDIVSLIDKKTADY
ncbi:aminoacyl-tRNA hydrolase [Candidatus Daviesbacteria bacterium]|nr:aminoacyl-tRNA hydrolase [Candidatus Daviesbacteria bacterium]